jgi:hypothetical protein
VGADPGKAHPAYRGSEEQPIEQTKVTQRQHELIPAAGTDTLSFRKVYFRVNTYVLPPTPLDWNYWNANGCLRKNQVWRFIMKLFMQAVAVAAVLAVPAVSFAQSNAPLTRAEVRAQLVQFEKAGPADTDASYPVQTLAAESKVAAQNGASTGYGGVVSGSSASGARPSVSAADWRSMYGNP